MNTEITPGTQEDWERDDAQQAQQSDERERWEEEEAIISRIRAATTTADDAAYVAWALRHTIRKF